MPRLTSITGLFLLLVSACQGGDESGGVATWGPSPGTSSSGTGEPTSTDSGQGDAPTGGSSGDSAGTDHVKFDVASLPDAAPPEPEGCTKVDLLFIIDDSSSMADEQDNLQASFGGFMDGIKANLEDADDFHVGVVTTDAYKKNAPNCTAIGNLVTETGGVDSSDAVCGPFAEDSRFMTQDDDLVARFSCAAKPGTSGSGAERPFDAARAALSQNQNAVGACNEGFLRDDALLILIFITDEEDDHLNDPESPGSVGDPIDWFNDIVAIKGGIQTHVVVLALVGHDKPNDCPPDQWDGNNGGEIATRIIEFTNMFTNGTYGDVCAPSYHGFFNDAVSVADSACANFDPPG